MHFIDKHIANGIPNDRLGRYSHESLVYIAQRADIDTDGL